MHENQQAAGAPLPIVHRDVACTVCGCVCDDLAVTVENGRITRAEGACFLAEPWFLAQETLAPPAAEIDGIDSPYLDAIRRAAGLLSAAKSPLLYGLSRSSTPGQRAAIRLADRLGATIDTTASLCHAPSIMAIQEVGESTCTLGEIKGRADLVMFWGVDPMMTHPRHFERYSVEPAGMFVPQGRRGRHVIVVDHQPSESSALADEFVCIEPPGGCPLGAPLAALRGLAERMMSCRCGVLFFGLGLARSGVGHRNVEALLRLVTDLNEHTRFHARRMRIPGDVTGADSVLCWQTGFPFSVNFARGYPRYSPGEYTANDMLERGEADVCLFVGTEGVAEMSASAREYLAGIPTIALDHPTVPSAIAPAVRFTTAVYGIHLPGTAYRMDEVPIPLRPVLPAMYRSDEQVLRDISAAL